MSGATTALTVEELARQIKMLVEEVKRTFYDPKCSLSTYGNALTHMKRLLTWENVLTLISQLETVTAERDQLAAGEKYDAEQAASDATEIARLESEVARLTEERDGARAESQRRYEHYVEETGIRVAAEVENERLTTALTAIARKTPMLVVGNDPAGLLAMELGQMASTALAAGGPAR